MTPAEQQHRRRQLRDRQQKMAADLAEKRKAKQQKAVRNQKIKRKRLQGPSQRVRQPLDKPDFQPALYNN